MMFIIFLNMKHNQGILCNQLQMSRVEDKISANNLGRLLVLFIVKKIKFFFIINP